MTDTLTQPVKPCGCETLTGRRRDICLGISGLPLETVNKYRVKWQLPALEALPERAEVQRTPITTRQPGVRAKGCCGGRSKPTLYQRAVKLAQATARHAADGFKPTPEPALSFRQTQCDGCPLRSGNECSACGCTLTPNLINSGKQSWRTEDCPAGKWHRHNDTYRPLVNPTRNLIFHLYPLAGAEWNWHWHCDQIVRHAGKFNGKIVVAIVTGANLAKPSIVQERLKSIPNIEFIIRQNSPLAETVTAVDLLRAAQTDDPNTITWRMHCKGVTHKRNDVEQEWAMLMWDSLTDIDAVQDALASHIICGPLKSHEPLVKRKQGDFFFAGSCYAFRSDVFRRNWAAFDQTRWAIEYWPCNVAQGSEAACLVHDFTRSSVLTSEYWQAEVRPDWDLWKASRNL